MVAWSRKEDLKRRKTKVAPTAKARPITTIDQ